MFDLHVLLHTIWPLLFFTDSPTYYFRRYIFSLNLVFPIHTLCLLHSISYSPLRHCFCFTQSRIHHSDIVLFYSISYSPLRHCFCFILSRIHHSHIVFASLDLVFTIETLFCFTQSRIHHSDIVLFHSISYSPLRHCFCFIQSHIHHSNMRLFHSLSYSPFGHCICWALLHSSSLQVHVLAYWPSAFSHSWLLPSSAKLGSVSGNALHPDFWASIPWGSSNGQPLWSPVMFTDSPFNVAMEIHFYQYM